MPEENLRFINKQCVIPGRYLQSFLQGMRDYTIKNRRFNDIDDLTEKETFLRLFECLSFLKRVCSKKNRVSDFWLFQIAASQSTNQIALTGLGETVSDIVIIAKILSSLPSKFRGFRSAWNSVEPTRQTVEYLEQRLLEEESFLEKDDEENGAFSATVKKRNQDGGSDTKPERKKRDKQLVKCFCCNAKGHYARECPRRPGINASSVHEDFDNLALVTTINEKHRPNQSSSAELDSLLHADTADTSIIDSGASEHITSRRDWFSDYRERHDGATISLGDDDECEVIGEGTVFIKRLVNANPVSVPADPHNSLRSVDNEGERLHDVPFREAVGSLTYLAIVSRPDISFATSNVSKFLDRHNASHWHAVKKILAYLRAGSDRITISRSPRRGLTRLAIDGAQHSHDEVRSENHTHKRAPDAGAKAQLERMMAPEARTTLTR
ncbi:unnamed protein product [Trichogramma brassicae]|uniref:CCHC-type domain-containing protein n=1 Tax=Trichogramma brassicae TaxID=86971 RepID=A0A6H5IRF5_9HYME|nr:unnamed protein product [Trichogramma brassicae]